VSCGSWDPFFLRFGLKPTGVIARLAKWPVRACYRRADAHACLMTSIERESIDAGKLHRLGLLTALAIGIHNFPEGIATFFAALTNPTVGLSVALAIALHNIPEGISISIPVYYATGNRRKAFWYSFLSGAYKHFYPGEQGKRRRKGGSQGASWGDDSGRAGHCRAGNGIFLSRKPGNGLPAPSAGPRKRLRP